MERRRILVLEAQRPGARLQLALPERHPGASGTTVRALAAPAARRDEAVKGDALLRDDNRDRREIVPKLDRRLLVLGRLRSRVIEPDG